LGFGIAVGVESPEFHCTSNNSSVLLETPYRKRKGRTLKGGQILDGAKIYREVGKSKQTESFDCQISNNNRLDSAAF
jgi:hypothetical protein